MAYLKSTTIGGKLNVIGTLATNEATIGSTTVNGIATSITNDATKLATAKAVYDYITSNAGVMSSTASGKTVTTKVTTGGWFAKNATSSASVNDASGFSLSITDKSTTNITVGTVSSGYYPLSASLTGTFSASTEGWFSSGSATDSSVVVGRVAQSTVGTATANTTDSAAITLDPGKQTTISAGYYPSARIIRASVADAAGEAVNVGAATFAGTDKGSTNVTIGSLSSGYYPITAGVEGTVTFASAGWIAKTGVSIKDTSVVVGRVAAATITANTPTVSVTNGAVTPSVGGTVTSKVSTITTKKPSGTDGTDYVTINPGASIATQPTATPSYTYSATAGYTPVIDSTTKTGTATNVTPTINGGTNYYLPKKTPKFDGGGLSGGGLTAGAGSVSATGSSITITEASSKPSSGYYVTVTGSGSVSRAAVTRAAVLYNGAVNGWVNIADNTSVISADSTTIGATSASSNTATKYYTISTETKTATTSGDITPSSGKLLSKVSVPAATPAFDGGYLSGGGLTAGIGRVSATGSSITITEASSKPNSGYYITVTGSGSVSRAAISRAAVRYNGAVNGWVNIVDNATVLSATTTDSTSASSNTETKYYTISTETKTATTSGDITPSSGKLLSKVSVPAATPKFDGGGCSGGGLSGGGLSITTNYSGTPTVTVASGSDTNMRNITVGTKAQSGYPYYFKVSGSSSALSGKTKATRAAVTRAAVARAAVKYNGAVDGWVEVADNKDALSANSTAIAADSTTIGATSVEPTVTVNAGSGSTYVGIKAAVITNGFVTGAGYMPGDDTAAYKTQYNATDDCVDILFN